MLRRSHAADHHPLQIEYNIDTTMAPAICEPDDSSGDCATTIVFTVVGVVISVILVGVFLKMWRSALKPLPRAERSWPTDTSRRSSTNVVYSMEDDSMRTGLTSSNQVRWTDDGSTDLRAGNVVYHMGNGDMQTGIIVGPSVVWL